MKKPLALLLALTLTLALTACGSGGADPSGSVSTGVESLLLGVFEPTTTTDGARETLGIQYAHSLRPTVTVGGVTYQVILDVRDSQSGQSAAEQLISDGCVAVLGSCDTGDCLAAAGTFADAQVPVLSPTCADSGVTLGNDYTFQARWQEGFQGTLLADWATAHEYQEVATVSSVDDESISSLVAAFTARFEENGGKVVAAETFPSGATNFDTVLANLKASGVRAVFAPTNADTGVRLLNQAANQHLKVQWMAGDTWNTPALLENAGKNAEGVLVSCAYAAGANVGFDQGFQAWLEADPDRLEANGGDSSIAASQVLAYDAYNGMLDAMEAAGTLEGPAIRDALAELEQPDAVSGAFSFDRNGNAVRSTACLLTVKDGAFTFTDTIALKK